MLYKAGLRYLADGSTVQRYLCRSCGYRFSDSSKKVCNRLLKTNGYNNIFDAHGKKALVMEVKEEMEKWAAGATNIPEASSNILAFAWHLKRLGRSEDTITRYVYDLRRLEKLGANLEDPQSVLDVIAKLSVSNIRKNQFAKAYKQYAKFRGLTFEPPNYKPTKTLPFIPLESEIDQLIACCNHRMAALLQLLKETGMRVGEALNLKWIDLDVERRIVKVSSEKGGEPRFMRLSSHCIQMLNALPRKSDYIFGGKTKINHYQKSLQWFRRKAAYKLQNPRLLKIHFHTLRHWFATMLYHKTKDPWHVKRMLGHRSLSNTEIYINIENALFPESSEEFHVKVARSIDEAVQLVEQGFEYVCEMDGAKIFRKRK
ncbi:MAG: tyrosine-type recombinase/integrase [Candidatus Bathyarchaeia archaeon]